MGGADRRTSGLRHWNMVWPMALAAAIRLATWASIPPTRFASDEESYFQVATAVLTEGRQDLFWPPVTGWLIALIRWALQTDSVAWVRLAWIALDLGCVVVVHVLARRVSAVLAPGHDAQAARFSTMATLAYACYLPAIAHAQFATSEIPALLQTLLVLVLLSRPEAGPAAIAGAGLLLGTLALTRPSLLPLLVLLPAADALRAEPVADGIRRALTVMLVGITVVGAVMYKNWVTAGELTIARNGAYNLYVGNRDVYGEDLNLFSPRATPEQVEYRRRMWRGEPVIPNLTPAEFEQEAFAWIASHPATFARRMAGRLARVFAPKTDVLELVGGERRWGVFSRSSLLLLAAANLQWTFVLFGGMAGLTAIARHDPGLGRLLLATIAGSLLLCLVAIAKPRYSFVFDPVLIMGAVAFFSDPRGMSARLRPVDRWVLAVATAFILWGWAAWLIFAWTSRTMS